MITEEKFIKDLEENKEHKMLDEIITDLIVWRNLKKIAPEDRLLSLFPDDKPNLMTMKINGEISWGYHIRFLYTDQGIIKYGGHPGDFPKETDHYHKGIFVVVLDPKVIAMARNGRAKDSIREERITEIIYNSPEIPEKAKKRLEDTKDAYNERFGFSDHYLFIEGFTEEENFQNTSQL